MSLPERFARAMFNGNTVRIKQLRSLMTKDQVWSGQKRLSEIRLEEVKNANKLRRKKPCI